MTEQRTIEQDVDLPLECAVVGNELVLRIGVNTLAWAGGHCPDFWDGEAANADGPYIKVTDPLAFAREVALALNAEREDGSNLLSDVLDAAIKAAVEDGCEGVDHE